MATVGSWVGVVFWLCWVLTIAGIIGGTHALKKYWRPGAPYRTWFFGTQITDTPAMFRLCLRILQGTEMPAVRPWLFVGLAAAALFVVLCFAPSVGPPSHHGH